MPINPSIALSAQAPQTQPTDPLKEYGNVLALKNMIQQQAGAAQQQQMGKLQLQQAQQEIDDQRKMRQAYMESGGDLDKLRSRASELGVGPNTMLKLNDALLKQRETLAGVDDKELNVKKAKTQAVGSAAQAVLQLPREARPQGYTQTRATLIQQGLIKPEDTPEQYPGDEAMQMHANTARTSQQIIDGILADRRAKAEETRATAAQTQAQTASTRSAAELPGIEATAEVKRRQNASVLLAGTKDQADYESKRGSLPYALGRQFPDKFDHDAVLKAGMSPDQQAAEARAAAAQAETAAAHAETARHNREAERHARSAEFEMGPAGAPGAPGQTGEAALGKYPKIVQDLARQLTEYKIPLPQGVALSRPGSPWNMAIQAAGELDPTFDASQYQVRLGVKRDFTSGKASQAVTSFNTVIGHLGTLAKAAEKLKNFSGPVVNRAKNWLFTNTGDPRVREFDVAKNAVADELTRAFRMSSGSETDVQAWKKEIDAADSPDQLKGSVNQALGLLGSRIRALQNQYERGMGKPGTVPLLSAKSRQILQGIGANPDDLEGGGAPAHTAAAPPAGPAALPRGGGKVIDQATAQQFYKAAGSDPDRARQMAKEYGWVVQ